MSKKNDEPYRVDKYFQAVSEAEWEKTRLLGRTITPYRPPLRQPHLQYRINCYKEEETLRL